MSNRNWLLISEILLQRTSSEAERHGTTHCGPPTTSRQQIGPDPWQLETGRSALVLGHILPQISRLGFSVSKQSIQHQMADPQAEAVRLGTALAQAASPVCRDLEAWQTSPAWEKLLPWEGHRAQERMSHTLGDTPTLTNSKGFPFWQGIQAYGGGTWQWLLTS